VASPSENLGSGEPVEEEEPLRWPSTELTARVGVRYPIVQAPMAGSTSPELVAATSNAGGLGSLGGALLPPEDLRRAIGEIRRLTDRPFNVNLFAWSDPREPDAAAVEAVVAALAPYQARVGVPDDAVLPLPPSLGALLDAQLAVVAEEAVPVFSFAFGIPPLEAARAAGAVIMGTATTVEEAVALEQAGVDVVVAQGAEAGGHRGGFLAPFDESMIGTLALVPQIVDRVRLPVVAAGGIMDGRGIAAALALGAQGVQMGTAFLACPDSAAHPLHRAALERSADTDTCVTAVYSGRPARAVRTALIRDLEARLAAPLDFPLQYARTGPVHYAAADKGDADLMFLLAGQAARLARPLRAAELVETLAREAETVIRSL
jgi:nitronate monooxygenase